MENRVEALERDVMQLRERLARAREVVKLREWERVMTSVSNRMRILEEGLAPSVTCCLKNLEIRMERWEQALEELRVQVRRAPSPRAGAAADAAVATPPTWSATTGTMGWTRR